MKCQGCDKNEAIKERVLCYSCTTRAVKEHLYQIKSISKYDRYDLYWKPPQELVPYVKAFSAKLELDNLWQDLLPAQEIHFDFILVLDYKEKDSPSE